MSSSASSRGWGPGWPNAQTSKMVTIKAGGVSLRVRSEVAPIFKGFCDELVQRGYRLDAVADDWGFANRPIRGTENRANPVPSNHSWGLAIDLNSTANPMGKRLVTDFPKWAVELGEKKYGLSWGGRYKSNPDAMHWEFLGTPAQARQIVAMLAALPAEQQPPEPDEDDLMPFTDDDRKILNEAREDVRRVRAETDKFYDGSYVARIAAASAAATVEALPAANGGDPIDEDKLAEAIAQNLAKRMQD